MRKEEYVKNLKKQFIDIKIINYNDSIIFKSNFKKLTNRN